MEELFTLELSTVFYVVHNYCLIYKVNCRSTECNVALMGVCHCPTQCLSTFLVPMKTVTRKFLFLGVCRLVFVANESFSFCGLLFCIITRKSIAGLLCMCHATITDRQHRLIAVCVLHTHACTQTQK